MKSDPTVTLLVMTMNEIEGCRKIMPLIDPSWVDQILFVDGGSVDGTVEWCHEQGYEIHVQRRKGFRHGYMEALPLIRGDVVITFSPDGNSLPEVIPQLTDMMKKGYDLVIASRYLDGAKSDDDDLITGFGNWLFTKTVNLLFGANYTDAMVIYRAYRKSLISDLELDQDRWYSTPEKLLSTVISWEPLMSARAARRKLKIGEIPADEPARIGGVRKLQIIRWGGSYFFQFLRDWFLWK